MQTLSRIKSLKVREAVDSVRHVRNRSVMEWNLPKSQALDSVKNENTERVREDESGDREDCEDDERPGVIGESEGDCI